MPGLYVHIPFCLKKCRYCDFPSFAGAMERIPAYLSALKREARARGSERDWGAFTTVFIGGGTPSLLPPGATFNLMEALRAAFTLADGAEITIECNPGAVTHEKFSEYHEAGINRVSLGLQSADDRLLRAIGRVHRRDEFECALNAARDVGFHNINVDVMHGLPGQSTVDYLATLQFIFGLKLPHVSAYGLILEEGVPLEEDVRLGRVTLPQLDAVADMQDAGMALFAQNGYVRYEISNFALPGFTCRHNINYWENGPYLGLGLGAHSAWKTKAGWQRFFQTDDLTQYLCSQTLPAFEHIGHAEERFETIMLGLRMTAGFSLSGFTARFGEDFLSIYGDTAKALENQGLLCVEPELDRVRLSERGLDLQNSVLLAFYPQ